MVIIVLVVIAALIIAAVYNSRASNKPVPQQSNVNKHNSSAYEPTDSNVKDSLLASKINAARLKKFVQQSEGKAADTASLDSQINAVINANKDIIFGISIKFLNTGQVLNYGNAGAMTAASVTKVLTAVDYYKQVELGHKSLNTVMANGQTAQANIEQMIVVSDNNAWHLLNDSLTYAQMGEYAKSIGLNSYNYVDNTISASDTTKLLADMYERKLINETNAQTLLSYMERANYRDLIIPAVPETDTVYHKAGEYLVNLNDAAIITDSKLALVLSIYTESTGSYSKSRVATLMQQITTPTLETFHLN